ncbi:VCBS domain-containing protein [Massilia sp. H-1]|nr:VCBS domain-containing protein [Massilia sp. H-1]
MRAPPCRAYGSLTINAVGAWTYTASTAHNEFVGGTTYTDIITVRSADNTATTVTINILGTNDAAVISATTVPLTETNAVLTASGTVAISDADSAATFVVIAPSPAPTAACRSTAPACGTTRPARPTTSSCGGSTYSDTFTITSADGTTSTIKVNIIQAPTTRRSPSTTPTP